MEFSNYLSQKRTEKHIPIRKFAATIGISPSFLCDLESGARAFPVKSKFPELLENMIAAINEKYGSVLNYLKEAIHIDEEKQNKLKLLYLE